MLEAGVAPWQKPWNPVDASLDMPMNPTTGKAHRGGNAIHVMATSLLRGYGDPRWMTYRQPAAVLGWRFAEERKEHRLSFGRYFCPRKDLDTSEVTAHQSDGAGSIVMEREGHVRFRCPRMAFDMAYQVRVAIDCIRFAIKATEQFAHGMK